jgi:hypothetical protein
VVKPLTHICNLKFLKALQKRFGRDRSQKEVAAKLHTTSLKTQETITKVCWTDFPQPPYSPDLIPQFSNCLRAPRDTISGQRFGSDEVIEEVKQLPTKLKLVQEEMPLFLAGAKLLRFMQIMHKNEVYNATICRSQ